MQFRCTRVTGPIGTPTTANAVPGSIRQKTCIIGGKTGRPPITIPGMAAWWTAAARQRPERIDHDTNVSAPSSSSPNTPPFRRAIWLLSPVMPLNYNWTGMKKLMNGLSPTATPTRRSAWRTAGCRWSVAAVPNPARRWTPNYQVPAGHHPVDRRPEHRRTAGTPTRPRSTRGSNDLRQRQGRGHHPLHRAGRYRRRSDVDAAAELRQRPEQVLPADVSTLIVTPSSRSAPRFPTCASPNRRFDQHRESITLRACARTRGMTEARQWIVARRRSIASLKAGRACFWARTIAALVPEFPSPAPRAPGCRNGAAADPLCGRPQLLQLRCGPGDRVWGRASCRSPPGLRSRWMAACARPWRPAAGAGPLGSVRTPTISMPFRSRPQHFVTEQFAGLDARCPMPPVSSSSTPPFPQACRCRNIARLDVPRRIFATGRPEISDLFLGPVLRRNIVVVQRSRAPRWKRQI